MIARHHIRMLEETMIARVRPQPKSRERPHIANSEGEVGSPKTIPNRAIFREKYWRKMIENGSCDKSAIIVAG